MKKFILFLGGVAATLLIFIIYCNYQVESISKSLTYKEVEDLPHNKVGVVLGTSKYVVGGGINQYYENRIEAAYEVFNSGKVDYLLVSGDNALMEYNEPMRMKKSLVKRGIPEEKIYLDYAGFRTLDSVVRAKEVFDQKSYTVISQDFHNERAIYIGKKFGIEIVAYNAKNPGRRRLTRREVLARVKAVLDVKVLNTQPKFLGEVICIGKTKEEG